MESLQRPDLFLSSFRPSDGAGFLIEKGKGISFSRKLPARPGLITLASFFWMEGVRGWLIPPPKYGILGTMRIGKFQKGGG
jgi:hypothetical protein